MEQFVRECEKKAYIADNDGDTIAIDAASAISCMKGQRQEPAMVSGRSAPNIYGALHIYKTIRTKQSTVKAAQFPREGYNVHSSKWWHGPCEGRS
jgi:hypothetical protein